LHAYMHKPPGERFLRASCSSTRNSPKKHLTMVSLEGLFSNSSAPGAFGATVGLDFFETQLVESEARTTVEDANDDLKIEVELYKNALTAAQAAVRKFETSSKPFFRPTDYFAEMIKSDAHMETIRLRLVEEAEGLKASEEAKKKRELKKFGKAIQVENKLQREKETKRIKEGVKELRKKRKDVTKLDGQDAQEFDVAIEETLSSNPKKRAGGPSGGGGLEGRKKSRTARDHKFGRPKPKGVTGRRWKENTKASAASFEGMGGKGDGKLSSGSSSRSHRGRARGAFGSAKRGSHRTKRS